jgi:cation diffusion facilitator family transporter
MLKLIVDFASYVDWSGNQQTNLTEQKKNSKAPIEFGMFLFIKEFLPSLIYFYMGYFCRIVKKGCCRPTHILLDSMDMGHIGGDSMDQQKYQDLKLGERGAIIGIIAYLCLAVLKLMIAHFADSEALKADGLNNTTDIIASTAVLIGLKISQKPADYDHTYGHWKAETVASMVASFIMMAVGIQILLEAVPTIFNGGHTSPDLFAAWTGMFCAIVMYGVYRYNKSLANKINSQSIMAAAKDNLSDAWVSIGTAVGIMGSQFQLPWLDPLAAIIVGLLICKTAWDIFRDASYNLTDGFDENEIQAYKETIQNIYGVKGIKEIKARNYGNNKVVDVVILVNSTLAIKDAHDISTDVEQALATKHDVYVVNVHVEPN